MVNYNHDTGDLGANGLDYTTLGQRVRYYRVKLHLTQEQLAEKVDISASFLGHIERGSRAASLDTVMKLCSALAVTPNDLLGDDQAIARMGLPEQVTIAPGKLLHNIALLLMQQESR